MQQREAAQSKEVAEAEGREVIEDRALRHGRSVGYLPDPRNCGQARSLSTRASVAIARSTCSASITSGGISRSADSVTALTSTP